MVKTRNGDVVGSGPPLRIIRRRELRAKVGYSAAHIDRLEKAGDFPKRVVLGPGAVGWLEHECDGWIRARVAERDAAA
jgi:prophage regulatory protein